MVMYKPLLITRSHHQYSSLVLITRFSISELADGLDRGRHPLVVHFEELLEFRRVPVVGHDLDLLESRLEARVGRSLGDQLAHLVENRLRDARPREEPDPQVRFHILVARGLERWGVGE